MKKELEFAVTYSADMTLKSRRILDIRKLFDWSMVTAGGVLIIAALIFPAAAPILIIASVGVGLVKEFFGSYLPDKTKLERGARKISIPFVKNTALLSKRACVRYSIS